MRKTWKLLALLLALLMLLPLVVACAQPEEEGEGNGEGTTAEVEETTTETEVITDKWGQVVIDNTELRSQDFNGKAIYIICRDGAQYQREWFSDKPESALQQEIYYRNLAVEEEINVKLNYNAVKSSDAEGCKALNTQIKNTGESGQGGIDIVSHYAAYASNASLMVYYKNWYSQDLKWLNLENPYWNQSFIENAEAFDRLFLCVGDVNLSVYDRSMVVFFNRKLATNDYAERVGDIFQTVLDGDWTSEVMYTMIKDLHEDGGTPEDETDDIYGLASIKGSEASDGMLYSWDAWLTETNEDGTHQIVTGTKRTKLSNAFDQMTKIWYQSNGAKLLSKSQVNFDFFTGGHALFDIDVLYHYDSGKKQLDEMQDEFGIIPLPKYDEDQTEYYTGVQDAHNVMSIMNNGMKSDFTAISAVLELLCAENYETVRPSYIETNIKGKFLSDANSVKCFELVLNGTRWDFADIYAKSVEGVRNKLWRAPFQKFNEGQSFTTAVGTYEEPLNTALTTLDQWLVSNY